MINYRPIILTNLEEMGKMLQNLKLSKFTQVEDSLNSSLSITLNS